MIRKNPHIEISVKEFYKLIIEKINNPGPIPTGDWLPPEIIVDGYIVNDEVSVENELVFSNLSFENVRIIFLNCKLNVKSIFKSFNLQSLIFLYTDVNVVELSNSILDVFEFKFSTGISISISDSNFKQHISIRESTIIGGGIGIKSVKTKSQIGITNVDSKVLDIRDSNSNLNFCSGKYDIVRLINNNFTTAHIFSLNNRPLSVITPMVIENSNNNFRYGKLELGPDFNNSVIINGKDNLFQMDELVIRDSIFSDIKVTIDKISVSSVKIIRLVNESSLKLFNIYPMSIDSLFQIENSILGITRISNCDMGKFSKFKFVLSDIREISYNNVEWPDDLCKESTQERAELYKQLKHIANRNNDSINGVRFYSIEKGEFYNKLRWTWKEAGTKLIFLFNKLSNNYNLSWIQPVLWNLLIQFVLFVIIIYTVSERSVFFYNYLVFNFKPILKFLFLLNPIFKSEEIHPLMNNYNLAVFSGAFSRIISAYLIYQTIAAYRRHN